MKLRSLLVDDEVHARENLKYLLQQYCPDIEVVGMASDGETARAALEELAPQVIFLDICMPSGTEGFDFLESLPEKKFQVVFVTAFKDYAIRALNANAVLYLMKPVDMDELELTVKKLISTQSLFTQNQEQLSIYNQSLKNLSGSMVSPDNLLHMTIRNAGGFQIVDPANFMYLEGEGDSTIILFSDGSSSVDAKAIGVYESILDPRHFFRIHRSHIVRILDVREFLSGETTSVVMKNGKRLPVSRQRVPQFLTVLKQAKSQDQDRIF